MKYQELFDLYRSTQTLSEEDKNFYMSQVSAEEFDILAPLLVSAVMLSLMENEIDEDRLQLLLHSYADDRLSIINERTMVGILLVAMIHDRQLRENDSWLNALQDVLTLNPEMSFTALCNIVRTSEVAHVEGLQNELAGQITSLKEINPQNLINALSHHTEDIIKISTTHYDQAFMLLGSLYTSSSFFKDHDSHWMLPWKDKYAQTVDKEKIVRIQQLSKSLALCDSDKFALLYSSNHRCEMLIDLFAMGHPANSDEEPESIITNGYVQQLYRFFRLSRHTKIKPFEQVKELNQCIVYRLVVVGAAAKRTIDQLLV